MRTNKRYSLAIINTVAFVAMVAVNYLGEMYKFGGVTSADVSNTYPTLFTPIGYTFSIWGIIYGLLVFYTARQFMKKGEAYTKDVGVLFLISSLLNIAWIFAWHYKMIGVSFVIIALLLWTLIGISKRLQDENAWIRMPFSVYTGWITVATMANLFVLLTSLYETFHKSNAEIVSVSAAIIVAGIIAAIVSAGDGDEIYALTIGVSVLGIIANQLVQYNGEYIAVYVAGIIAIAMVLSSLLLNRSSKSKHWHKLENGLNA